MSQYGEDLSTSSEADFMEKYTTCVNAGPGVVHIRTPELMRTLESVRQYATVNDIVYREWDIVHGFRTFDRETVSNKLLEGNGVLDIGVAISEPHALLRDNSRDPSQSIYFVYVNVEPFMTNNPQFLHFLLMYADLLPSSTITVLLVTGDNPLPSLLEDTIPSLVWPMPAAGELYSLLKWILDNLPDGYGDGISGDEDALLRVCRAGAGLTCAQFSLHASMAITQAVSDGFDVVTEEALIKGISEGKTAVVSSNDLLELYDRESMDHVGGLENLKKWIGQRTRCFSDEARAFGITPPKGLVLTGIPGTGKSLVAKAIASSFGLPLVRLDFSRVFNSLVGESERRMRTALTMIESMSPIVVLVDEIDKGLGGAGGSGDSGTSSRVLGSFLSWLQDCTKPVFCVVTANNVTGLPPELLRRGRFDAIFSTTLPTAAERREVFRIHLGKRGRSIDDIPDREVSTLLSASEGYVPAEIEACVKDGLIAAFSEEEEFSASHMVGALRAMVPMSKSHASAINAMREWAESNATPAGAVNRPSVDTPTTRRNITRPRLVQKPTKEV